MMRTVSNLLVVIILRLFLGVFFYVHFTQTALGSPNTPTAKTWRICDCIRSGCVEVSCRIAGNVDMPSLNLTGALSTVAYCQISISTGLSNICNFKSTNAYAPFVDFPVTELSFADIGCHNFCSLDISCIAVVSVVARDAFLAEAVKNNTTRCGYSLKNVCNLFGLVAGEWHNHSVCPTRAMSSRFRKKIENISSPACGPITDNTTRSICSGFMLPDIFSRPPGQREFVFLDQSIDSFCRHVKFLSDVYGSMPAQTHFGDLFFEFIRNAIALQSWSRQNIFSAQCSSDCESSETHRIGNSLCRFSSLIALDNFGLLFWGQGRIRSSHKLDIELLRYQSQIKTNNEQLFDLVGDKTLGVS